MGSQREFWLSSLASRSAATTSSLLHFSGSGGLQFLRRWLRCRHTGEPALEGHHDLLLVFALQLIQHFFRHGLFPGTHLGKRCPCWSSLHVQVFHKSVPSLKSVPQMGHMVLFATGIVVHPPRCVLQGRARPRRPFHTRCTSVLSWELAVSPRFARAVVTLSSSACTSALVFEFHDILPQARVLQRHVPHCIKRLTVVDVT